jgi:hypothetical protein
MTAILALLAEEFAGRNVTVHFGWPTSSWLDRLATGVLVWNLTRLPKRHPELSFRIEHLPAARLSEAEERRAREASGSPHS